MRVRTSGLAVLLVLAACGDDGNMPPMNSLAGAGAGGTPTVPVGGAGIGASGAGAGGASGAGAGAAGAGAGGAAGGMAGGGSGMGGAMAGMGGAGGAMMGAPTWTAVWTEIIQATGCNGGITCHQGSAGGLLPMPNKEMAYMNLVGKAAMGTNLGLPATVPHCKDSGMMRVVPGMPDMSLLVNKVEKTMPVCGGPMPPSPLTMAQQQQIRMWIMLGAKDD